MSEVTFEVNAELRTDTGKGASRRLRHANLVPAIIYGGGGDPVNLSIQHNKLFHALEHEAFYAHILTINFDGKSETAVLKDLQRHPAKPIIMHADFLRVNANEKLRMNVPLHFINEAIAPGVKAGGLVSHTMTDVEVSCLPANLPEFISVDIAELEMDHPMHLSDLALPEGVELVALSYGADHDLPVVSIHMSRAALETDEAVATEADVEGGEAPAAE